MKTKAQMSCAVATQLPSALYCSSTFMNRKERHGNVTASKAPVADTLQVHLVRKGSKECDDFLNMFKKIATRS